MLEKVAKQKTPYIKLHTFNTGISNERSTQRGRTIIKVKLNASMPTISTGISYSTYICNSL